MAKSSSFFNIRSGSTKSHTYQAYRGMQITKDRVTTVSNPQSSSQMEQRLLVPLVAAARQAGKNLFNHSFQNVDYGYKSLQEFSSVNLRSGALTVTQYVPKGAMDMGVADFIVSRGTLPNIPVSVLAGDEDNSSTLQANISCASLVTPTVDGLLKSFYGSLTKKLGIEGEIQLTILSLVETSPTYTWTASSQTYQNTRHKFVLSRLILNDTDDLAKLNSDWKLNTTGADEFGGVNTLSDGYQSMTFEDPASTGMDYAAERFNVLDQTKAAPTRIEGTGLSAMALILSQKVDTSWKRSSNRMIVLTPKSIPYAAAEPSYEKNASDSDRFLNFGDDATYITGQSYNSQLDLIQ